RLGPWLGGPLKERPSEIFKRHVKVVPYPEDDTVSLAADLGGTESLVMGSDWPHAEGLREPPEMYLRVEGLGEEGRRHFLRDNGRGLFPTGGDGPRPWGRQPPMPINGGRRRWAHYWRTPLVVGRIVPPCSGRLPPGLPR